MPNQNVKPAITAGFLYFAILFTIAFILGAIRVLIVIPEIGELFAVLLELPIVLGASWFLSLGILRRLAVSPNWQFLLVFGGSAFMLLMITELVLAAWAFNQSASEYFAHFQTLPGAIGLLGQILFGLIPLIQSKTGSLKPIAPSED